MAKKATTEIRTVATVEPTGYLALKDFDFHEVVASEMEGLEAVFDRIKMPSGDTTVFQIPSEDPDEPELAKEFAGFSMFYTRNKFCSVKSLKLKGSLQLSQRSF